MSACSGEMSKSEFTNIFHETFVVDKAMQNWNFSLRSAMNNARCSDWLSQTRVYDSTEADKSRVYSSLPG